MNAKDAESLNKHVQGRFPPGRAPRQPGKYIIFCILRAALVPLRGLATGGNPRMRGTRLINTAISGEYDSAHKSENISAHCPPIRPQRVPRRTAGVVFFWAKGKAAGAPKRNRIFSPEKEALKRAQFFHRPSSSPAKQNQPA
jgi:hypothetical protein